MSRLPHKLPKVATDQMAVVDGLGNGIQFGPGDLKMLLQRGEAAAAAAGSLADAAAGGVLEALLGDAAAER
jgi:hypothetical protein